MIEQCPVCGGRLIVDRRGRGLLKRGRQVVRCQSCRSVLRERGRNRWHYAVDPAPNPELYRRVNGKYLTEEELEALLIAPLASRSLAPDDAILSQPASVAENGAVLDEIEDEPGWFDDAAGISTVAPAPAFDAETPGGEAQDVAVLAAEPAAPPEPETIEAAFETVPEPHYSRLEIPLSDDDGEPDTAGESKGESGREPEEAPAPPAGPLSLPAPAPFEAPRFIEDDDWDDVRREPR